MRVLTVNPADPRQDRLDEAVARLREGQVVALPTETFYGLAVDSGRSEALLRINRLKGKPENSPVLLLLGSRGQVRQVCDPVPATGDALIDMFWPGPLTLLLPAAPGVAREVTGGGDKVGVRLPGLALPRRLAALLERPISGISANRHGAPACRTAADVAAAFEEGVDLVLDGGPTPGGAPSTVVDLTVDPPRLVRRGLVPVSSLRPFLPELDDAPL